MRQRRTKWGSTLDGIPIVPPEAIPGLEPDAIFISMLNKDACSSVRARLEAMQIRAKIVTAPELRQTFDLRLAALRMIAQEVCGNGASAEQSPSWACIRGFCGGDEPPFPDRALYLFDTFSGFDQRDVTVEGERRFSRAAVGTADTSVGAVRQRSPHPDRAVFKIGYFPETAHDIETTFAVVSLDADLYKPLHDGLRYFYPLMTRGGYIIVHDYNNTRFSASQTCRAAVLRGARSVCRSRLGTCTGQALSSNHKPRSRSKAGRRGATGRSPDESNITRP